MLPAAAFGLAHGVVTVRVGGAGLAGAGVDVGNGLLVAAGAGLLRRPALELRLDAERRRAGEGIAVLLRGLAAVGVGLGDEDVAAARLDAEVGTVAVEVLALAGEVGQRVEELAVVGPAGAELVVDRLVAGRQQHLGAAEAEPVELRQGDGLALLGGAGQARGRFGEQLGDAARLLAGDQRAGLLEPRFRGGDQVGELGDGRLELDRVGAQRRQRAVEVDQRGLRRLQGRRELADRAFEVFGLVGEGAGEDLEVVDQLLQFAFVPDEGAEGAAGAGDQPREVVGLGAEEAVGDLGPVAAGVAAVFEHPVERFAAALALHLGELGRVFGGRRRRVERRAEALEQVAEVGPHRRLQRGEDLVELDRGRGVADRDRAAAVHLRRAGAAGVEFDEEVALEEDPGADLGEGVLVDRPAGAADREADLGGVAVAFDADHFADFDAGDPDGRVFGDVDAVGEGRVELVAVAGEGDVFGEGEVGADRHDQQEDHGDRRVARPPREAPRFSLACTLVSRSGMRLIIRLP